MPLPTSAPLRDHHEQSQPQFTKARVSGYHVTADRPMLSTNGLPHQSSTLDEALFGEFRSVIYRHSGIFFEDNKRYLLESRLMQRMQAVGLSSFDAYRKYLMSPAGSSELHALTNAVTINETFFFRHPAHLELLEKRLLPELARIRAGNLAPRVRIWSAACSSGDEPYSIALLIRDRVQPLFPRIVFEIVATDIDSSVLATAQQATYAPYAVRNVPPHLLDRYFERNGDRFVLDPRIRDMVRFRQMNLTDDLAMQSMRGFDVVLCANVLIYFDIAAKRRTLNNIHNAMNTDGYLFIGFSETLFGVADAFVAERHDKILVYRRADQPVQHNGATTSLPFSHESTSFLK
jgi:chemotaxis protein methyltransferase CheR